MNSTGVAASISQWVAQIAGSILLVPAVVGLMSYSVCMVAILKERLYTNPYYALLIGLGVADIIGLACFAFFGLPATIIGKDMGNSWPNILMGVLLQVVIICRGV